MDPDREVPLRYRAVSVTPSALAASLVAAEQFVIRIPSASCTSDAVRPVRRCPWPPLPDWGGARAGAPPWGQDTEKPKLGEEISEQLDQESAAVATSTFSSSPLPLYILTTAVSAVAVVAVIKRTTQLLSTKCLFDIFSVAFSGKEMENGRWRR